MTHEETAIKTTYFSIIGNTTLALVKGLAGYFGNSYALIADAIESTADVFASFLVLFGIKYSNKPADENHPYGHGRAEPLVTFLVVGFLITSATIIAYESILNIGKAFTIVLTYMIWISIFLGYFSYSVNYLGGTFGFYLNEWMILTIGKIGTISLLIMSFYVLTAIQFNPNFAALFSYFKMLPLFSPIFLL